MRSACCLLGAALLGTSLGLLAAGACLGAVQVTVDAQGRRIPVSPDLYGIFYEEINHAGDGGLYAEMVQNRTFEENALSANMRREDGHVVTANGWRYPWKPRSDLHGWSAVAEDGAEVLLALDNAQPLNRQSPHAMRVEVGGVGGRAGFANEGYWGMSVTAGEDYVLSFHARGEPRATVTASLESADGTKRYAEATVRGVGGDWDRYLCALTAGETDPKARLVLSIDRPTTLWFDIVSLFPAKTYRGRLPGLRADLVGKLEELRPKFLRFPGGCVVEGCTLDNRIQWKQTVGDIAQRPGHWDLWGYRATDGLGFHEFLQLAEDLGAEAMYVCNVGMSCQARRAEIAATEEEIIGVYLQDTLDALEYAMGPAHGRWGSQRARNGHPEPFRIKYVEIGNENHGPDYHRAYRIFQPAIKARYPDVMTIANQAVPDATVEIIDEHYYVAPDWFFANANRYDRYDRDGPKIYVGEYAVNQGVGGGSLLGALAEAAFMLGMERNSDLVVMASYAPLFENVNDREWPVNLIRFDSSRVVGRSSFQVQRLLAENLPTVMLEAAVLDLAAREPPVPRGRIGLRTWRTDAAYRDIRVSRGDEVLFASDFAAGADDWEPRRPGGRWAVADGLYRQSDAEATDTLTLAGDPTWSDYTLEVKARRNRGEEGFMVVFRGQGRDHVQWNLGGWGNSRHAVQVVNGDAATIVAEAPGSIEAGRWYDVKVVLAGERVQCFLDGELIHDVRVRPGVAADFFANAGIDEAAGEVVVKLVNANAESRDVHLVLEGFGGIDADARVITLSGEHPGDENTLDDPLRIAPVESAISAAAESFPHAVPPWSVTVLRMKTRS